MRAFLLPTLGTGVLLGLVALLGLGLISQYSQDDSRTASLTEPASGNLAVAPASSGAAKLPMRPGVYFAAITERPIFAPSRRPVQSVADETPVPTEVVAEPSPEVNEAAPTVKLHGIRGQGEEYSVLLSGDGLAPEWIGPGASIGGWMVSEIGSDWITMKNGENSQRVELYQ